MKRPEARDSTADALVVSISVGRLVPAMAAAATTEMAIPAGPFKSSREIGTSTVELRVTEGAEDAATPFESLLFAEPPGLLETPTTPACDWVTAAAGDWPLTGCFGAPVDGVDADALDPPAGVEEPWPLVEAGAELVPADEPLATAPPPAEALTCVVAAAVPGFEVVLDEDAVVEPAVFALADAEPCVPEAPAFADVDPALPETEAFPDADPFLVDTFAFADVDPADPETEALPEAEPGFVVTLALADAEPGDEAEPLPEVDPVFVVTFTLVDVPPVAAETLAPADGEEAPTDTLAFAEGFDGAPPTLTPADVCGATAAGAGSDLVVVDEPVLTATPTARATLALPRSAMIPRESATHTVLVRRRCPPRAPPNECGACLDVADAFPPISALSFNWQQAIWTRLKDGKCRSAAA